MKIPRTTSFLIASSFLFTPQSYTIDPFTGALAAAAAGAIIGGTGYLMYDHAHYNSSQNCKDALEKFYQQLYADNLFLRAAHAQSIDALIPSYQKIVTERFTSGNSLRLSELSNALVSQAQCTINPLVEEYKRVQRYNHYQDYCYNHLVEKCQRALDEIQEFYRHIEYAPGYPHITEYLLQELHTQLHHELYNKGMDSYRLGAYPLHEYLKTLKKAYNIYKKFVHDNRIANYECNHLLQESEQAIQSIQKSAEFKLEEKVLEIEQLKTKNRVLEDELDTQKRKNNTLRNENDSLTQRNRRLTRLVQELKDRRYCRECQPHITVCLHDLI